MEDAALPVRLHNFSGNQGQEYKGKHKTIVTKMQLNEIKILPMVTAIGSYDEATGTIVLTIDGIGEAPFVMEGKINKTELTARIDSS